MDTQGAPAEARPLQPGNRGVGRRGVRHRNAAKPARAARLAVGHHPDGVDGPIRFTQMAQLRFDRRVRAIPHKHIGSVLKGLAAAAIPKPTVRAPQ